MSNPVPKPLDNMGAPAPRIDGRVKVTGHARYPSDVSVSSPAYAVFVTSGIARGEIRAFDLARATAIAGVLDILTWESIQGLVHEPTFWKNGGTSATSIRPMESARIYHDGQIIAVVLANTLEAAQEAAFAVSVDYAIEQPLASFTKDGSGMRRASEEDPEAKDPAVGDAATAYATAPVKIAAEYSTPTQHHNPIELFTTTCQWDGDQLTVYEPSQFVYGLRAGLAEQLAIPPERIRVVSTFIGGAFGSKGSVTPRTALIAIAARRIGRPVKLVATRAQGFTIATYRAETRHAIKLGANADGRLVSLSHEGFEVTSRPDAYTVAGTETTARLYNCPNVHTKVHVTHADRNTPGFMRSPPEVPYVFALESAMDELAVALRMDPVELRRVNDTMKEPIKGLPYTSRSLMACFDQAAAAFGWRARNPQPGVTSEGEWQIGWGCATSCYPAHVAPATTRVSLSAGGDVRVEIAAHDVGTGTYTVVAQVAAEALGVGIDKVQVAMADSALPPAPVSGGSNVTASACNAVDKACAAVRDKLAAAMQATSSSTGASGAGAARSGGLRPENGRLVNASGDPVEIPKLMEALGVGSIEEYAEFTPHGSKPGAVQKLYRGASPIVGGTRGEDRVQMAFGAEFVEVRVHRRTREITVPRIVGAFAAGRIVNPRTTHSQLMGGMIWGISSALHEATEIDERYARYTNTNLADYLIPVNADVPQVDVILVSETDKDVNPLGIKGVGELGNVGTNAAVANAVFHATGVRVRNLPIRLDALVA